VKIFPEIAPGLAQMLARLQPKEEEVAAGRKEGREADHEGAGVLNSNTKYTTP
jgi:hypothetical protein